MMKEFQLSLDILKSVFDEDTTFQAAIRTKFKNAVSLKDCRPTVSALTGCVLRHSILFGVLLKDAGEITSDEKYLVYIALANEYFVKRLKSDDVMDTLSESIKPELLEYAKKLIEKKDNPETAIPESINKSSLQYSSIRFNAPEWAIKIWKHFGNKILFKLLRMYSKPASSYVRVRNSMVETDEVLKDNSFLKTNIPNILEYKSKEPLRKNGFFERGEIFLEKPGIKAVLDKYALKSDNSEVMIFSGNSSDVAALEVIETYGERIGINIGVLQDTVHPEILKVLARTKQKNVNFFNADPESMMANISNEQDLVIAYPESTNFDSIREYPDYLLHFKKELMDNILEQQKTILSGCAKFVADQGNLLYMVPTVSMKECRGQVVEFLKNNTDFHLVEDAQLFPFDANDTSLYYALLHKGMAVAKVGVAPTSIINDQANSPVAQASSLSKN